MLVLLFVYSLVQIGPPTAEFDRGKAAYERAEYPRAIEILRPLLYPEIRLDTEGQVVEAHRMLGVAHLFEKQNQRASQEFRKLLQLRPDYRFDQLLDPPQVVDFFNSVLKEYEGELAKISARRRLAEQDERRQREALERARNGPAVIEKRYLQNSFSLNFVPFGVGQFQNGQRGKGWAFLVAESVLAGVSVGALTVNFATYGFRPKRTCLPQPNVEVGGPCKTDPRDEDRSQLLTRVQVVSGGLFFAVAAWGIADAILNFRSAVPLTLETTTARPASGLRVAPVLVGQSMGAGLAFRF